MCKVTTHERATDERRAMSGPVKSSGAHGIRIAHGNIEWHLGAAFEALEEAKKRAGELGASDQLAVAVQALRTIVSTKTADSRSLGIATAALAKMGVQTRARRIV